METKGIIFRTALLLAGFSVSFFTGRLSNAVSRWQDPATLIVGRWEGGSLQEDVMTLHQAERLVRELDAFEEKISYHLQQISLSDGDLRSGLDIHRLEQPVALNPSSVRHASVSDSNPEDPTQSTVRHASVNDSNPGNPSASSVRHASVKDSNPEDPTPSIVRHASVNYSNPEDPTPSSVLHASLNDSIREEPVEGNGEGTQSGNMSLSASGNVPWSSMDRVRYVLKRNIKHVEDEILDFNVGDILKEMSDESLRDSRIVQKLQRALTSPEEECVIRIVKYCAYRCAHFLGSATESQMQWKRFACPSVTSSCEVETRFASNMSEPVMGQTDILIFIDALHGGLQLADLMARRPPGQLWMLYSRESPQHDPEYAPPHGTDNPYNLTMTFFNDSDLHFPYCYTEKRQQSRVPDLPINKTKLITWMASNCRLLSWTRGAMVKELQKHLPIDSYGKCGDLGHLDDAMVDKTLEQYKFILAFENSECRDYITEKAWRTGLERGLVPIVYGSQREDYERALPPNSFIFLQDFTTMQDFVDYVRALDADDARYGKFFDWRADIQINCPSARSFIMENGPINMCFLLRKFIHIHAHPEVSWRSKVPDFKTWWEGKCSDVSASKQVLGINVHNAVWKPKNNAKKLN